MLAGFWSGGFEGADHVNASGVPLDLVLTSGHWHRLEEDHARAAGAGLSSVRESIGWRVSENAQGVIDLSRAQRVAESAQRHGLQVLWTLMHYGLPQGLSLHDDAMVPRFARFAVEVVKAVGIPSDRAPVFTPINEMGFLAWAASQPHLLHAPDNTVGMDDASIRGRGYDAKCRLVRAALLAMRAMRAEDPRCVFMHAEPLVHVVAPLHRPDLAELAQRVGSWQWQVWDLLTGVERPELGGHADSVDLMGVNHYHNSQWELESFNRLEWHLQDPRRKPLSMLLQDAWLRYRKPLVLAETSHVGSGRAAWLHEVAGEVRTARAQSVPLQGVCLYPLMDRPDWNDPTQWHRSGLWHVSQSEHDLPCVVQDDCAAALQSWQQHLPNAPSADLPLLVVL
ncbi:MAG: family 1 glycosylhydrolase, partial [Hydrogenophaga sp.]